MTINRLLFCLLILICISCGKDKAGSDVKTFIYNQSTAASSLDPAYARNQSNTWVTNHLFDGLVELDDELNIKPSIAKSWTISEDGLTYTFLLNADVYFHEDACFGDHKTRKVNANDFVYSFDRVLKTGTGAWIFKDRVVESDPFKAINDSTLVVQLQKPFLPFLGILTMQYASVVPQEAIDMYGAKFRSHPVGAGPFQLFKWEEGQAILLTKNQKYYQYENGVRLPHLERVKILQIEDKKTAFLDFSQGKIHMISGLESSFVNELLTPEGELLPKWENKLVFAKAPYLNSEYIGINMQKAKGTALGKKSIRQALNYAIDRNLMLSKLRNNVGNPATSGFTPQGLTTYSEDGVRGFTFDMDKAAALLAQGGYTGGKGMEPIAISTHKEYLDLVTYIAKQWEKLGIPVSIDMVDPAVLREKMTSGSAQLFKASWIADYPNAESFMTCFYSKNSAPPNYTQFNFDAFDKLYERCLIEQKEPYKTGNFTQMDRILVEEAPAIFLFYDETPRFYQKTVQGLGNNGMNLLTLKNVKL